MKFASEKDIKSVFNPQGSSSSGDWMHKPSSYSVSFTGSVRAVEILNTEIEAPEWPDVSSMEDLMDFVENQENLLSIATPVCSNPEGYNLDLSCLGGFLIHKDATETATETWYVIPYSDVVIDIYQEIVK